MASGSEYGFRDEDGIEKEFEGREEPLIRNQSSEGLTEDQMEEEPAKWINNEGEEVEEVFGFNENAELVNGRVAMVGFLMLILTELIFGGEPVTHGIFGIG